MTAHKWMRMALQLAEKARGKTSPNPMVGAVIVKEGKAVGKGFHRRPGSPHAEIEALRKAGRNAKGATLYVSLEPCCHQGKTPPCTEALIRSEIRKVIAAALDPNPIVHGKGIKQLEKAGIEVEVGLLEEEARTLNEVFFKWMSTRLPFVALKFAMTLDGRIATSAGDSRWVSGEKSREKVHEMRSCHDAILVGINTILQDDPLLTSRIPGGKNPVRLILDSRMRIPLESRVLKTISNAPTWVIAAYDNDAKRKDLEEAGAKVLVFPGKDKKVNLRAFCRYLGENEITSVFVEGGAQVHGSFLQAGLADKLIVFISPKIVGGDAVVPIRGLEVSSMSKAIRLKNVKVCMIEQDLLVEGYF